MNYEHNYWYFKSALPSRFCDDVIKYALQQKIEIGTTGEHNKTFYKRRKSNVVWLNENWIYKEVHPYVHTANKNAGWNFEWERSEHCQFTKYKVGQYYDWHCDSGRKPYDKEGPYKGKIRKLSMTCQLTDGSEYEGGELEFDFRNYDPHMRDESNHVIKVKEILPKGSIVVFPSHLWHRVKPVTKGTRYSLVLWHLGHPFK
jgi:PKHD-type hydroxylase